jgi:uncharacterized protein YutD
LINVGGRDTLNKQKIRELIEQREQQRADIYHVERTDTDAFTVNGHPYKLLKDYKEAFDPDKLADRFSTILSKYDYIVGDWGFEQLRLKGFYAVKQPGTQPAELADAIQDYLYEYCNFGCAYFIIQNLDVQVVHPEHTKRRRTKKNGTGNHGDARNNKKVNEHHDYRKKKQHKQNTTSKHKKGPQIRERTTSVNPVPVSKRKNQEVVRESGTKKKQKFVIRHK